MANLRDLAAEARVSIRTVNRVLKKKGYVGAASRRAVDAAVGKLGYHPNLAARALKAARSHVISVLSFTTDEMRMAQVAAFQQRLRREDYLVSLTFLPPEMPLEKIVAALGEMIAQGPAALAVLGHEPEVTQRILPEIIPPLIRSGVPYVLIDPKGFSDRLKRFDSVRVDRGRGVQEAVHYLADRGARRIAFLGTQEERTRLDSYEKAMKELGRAPLLLDYPGPDPRTLRLLARRFARDKKRADAVIAHSDYIALAFLAGLHDAGVKVPEDVALIGFDDRPVAELAWPALTTIGQPSSIVGQAGANILLRKIAGRPRPPGGWSLTFPTKLIIRETA